MPNRSCSTNAVPSSRPARSPHRRSLAVGAVLCLGFLAAACGSDDSSATTTTPATTTPATTAAPATPAPTTAPPVTTPPTTAPPATPAPTTAAPKTTTTTQAPTPPTTAASGGPSFDTFSVTPSAPCESGNATFTMAWTTTDVDRLSIDIGGSGFKGTAGYGPNETSVVASVPCTGAGQSTIQMQGCNVAGACAKSEKVSVTIDA